MTPSSLQQEKATAPVVARTRPKTPILRSPAARRDPVGALTQVRRTAGNSGLTQLIAQRQAAAQKGAAGPRLDMPPKGGDRARQDAPGQDLLPVQRKPTLSGLKKALGFGKKPSGGGPAIPASPGILPSALRPGGAAPAGPAAGVPPVPLPLGPANVAGSGSELGPAALTAFGRANLAGSGSELGPAPPTARGLADVAGSGSESEEEAAGPAPPVAGPAGAYAAGGVLVGGGASGSSSSSESSSESGEGSEQQVGGAGQYRPQGWSPPSMSGSESSSSESSSESGEGSEQQVGGAGQYRPHGWTPPSMSGSESSSEESSSSSSGSWGFGPFRPPAPPQARPWEESSEGSEEGRFPQKYYQELRRDRVYETEFTAGSPILAGLIADGERLVRDGRYASMDEFMKQQLGWTPDDIAKYGKPNQRRDLKVAALGKMERKDFELHGGATLKQGSSQEPYDTSKMVSKFMGSGFGIYVMDKRGRLYAAQHRVGIFHHSSFLAGGDVAGAGEMKVEGGVLKVITNKSGHYVPTDMEMLQVMEELEGRGVSLDGVEYIPIGRGGLFGKQPHPGGAKAFLRGGP